MLAPQALITLAQKSATILLTRTEIKILYSPPIADENSTSSLDPSTSGDTAQGHNDTPVLSNKRKNLFGFVDLPVTPEQATRANFKLFRFVVHANIPFSVAENWFFRNFLDEIRPSYQAPSRYVLSHSIMDSEVARVQIEDIARLKGRKRLTFLLDGWEDKIRRSLYGSLAAEVKQRPVALSKGSWIGCAVLPLKEERKLANGSRTRVKPPSTRAPVKIRLNGRCKIDKRKGLHLGKNIHSS
ncbi:hypothetical protein M405DRAFT_939003 [Rhizopogon salebrosus TDB-379]|nr:hypothetical protein M405DRAFT_939003 [Rhizopogon salebrosus TDB-379]